MFFQIFLSLRLLVIRVASQVAGQLRKYQEDLKASLNNNLVCSLTLKIKKLPILPEN